MKVLIAVTHLLGTGHLSRALTLGRAFAQAGHTVVVASGGMAAPQLNHAGVTLEQLPPLRSDGTNFTRLLDGDGRDADGPYLAKRQTRLADLIAVETPDVLITELFPFGRRSLREEFTALLEVAQALPRRPVILSSIRDILAPPSKSSKATQAQAFLDRFYDGVLVHSDPSITTLDVSWPVGEALAQRLHYTGYVAPSPAGPHPEQMGQGEILVSAGGGPVGDVLFEKALTAAARMPQQLWRLLVGGHDPDRITCLQNMAAKNVRVEPTRPEFRQMLYHAKASVSMCGYNTTMDLLQAGTPAVLVPFDDGNEVEQGLRADSLGHLPGFATLRSADLTPEALQSALTQVLAAERRAPLSHTAFDGAAETVRQAVEMAWRRP